MNDTQLVRELANLLDITFPTAETHTISVVSGTSIQFTDNIIATTNAWCWGIIEFTSGSAKNIRSIIIANQGNVVTLSSVLSKNLRPAPGDTVRIYGGPLDDARIYEYEPETTIDATEDGKRFIVTVSAVDGEISAKGLSGRSTKGIEVKHSDVRFSVTAEAPNYISDFATEDALKQSIYDLPTLKEQVALICFYFRMQENNRMSGVGNIEYTQVGIQRSGQSDFNRAYVIEFICRQQ